MSLKKHPPCYPRQEAPQNEPPPPRGRCRVLVWLYRRIRAILALGTLTMLLLIFTPAGNWLDDALDVTQPPQSADYIVCLGGRDERLIWAAELFKQGMAPKVIVSNMGTAALAMQKRIEEMGVPAENLLVDARSQTTGDHPGAVAALPGVDRQNQRFLIVTNREHSRRAAACFRHGDYLHFTIYAGRACSEMDDPRPEHSWRERTLLLPRLGYEYTGLLKYWLQGRI